MKLTNSLVIALFVSAGCLCTVVAAPADTNFNDGLAAYKKADYKTAAGYFHTAVTGGNNSAAAWLYLGHSYAGSNDKTRAVQVYRSLISKYPRTPEAQIAAQCVSKLAPAVAAAAAVGPAAAPPAPSPAVSTGAKNTLLDRITLYPPKFGHQPISNQTADTVREVVRALPPKIKKILDEGGATITIAPNIIDKWPGSGDGLKPGRSDMTMGEEGGRTYGRDVHVYEREQIRGTNDLKDIRPQSEIRNTTQHEIGHAVDDCSGLSIDNTFRAYHKLDLEDMPANVSSRLSYFHDPGEACAETIAGLAYGGDDDEKRALVLQYFPRLKRHIKEKLKI